MKNDLSKTARQRYSLLNKSYPFHDLLSLQLITKKSEYKKATYVDIHSYTRAHTLALTKKNFQFN